MFCGCGCTGCTGREDSRQNGGQREELGGQVGQVDQQEDEERLNDPNLLSEASDEAEDDGEHQTHQSASDTDDEEGGCGGGGRVRWVTEKSDLLVLLCFIPLCGLTDSFKVICRLNILRSDFHKGNVDFI